MKKATELACHPVDDGRCASWGGPSHQPERCDLTANHTGSHVGPDWTHNGRLEWGITPPAISQHDIEMSARWGAFFNDPTEGNVPAEFIRSIKAEKDDER